MILTCPSCATRYSVDGARFPAGGRAVRCAKCGHGWHQDGEAPEPAPEIVQPAIAQPDTILAAPESAPAPAMEQDAPRSPDMGADIAFTTRGFTPAAVAVEKPALLPRLAVAAGWLGLIVVVVLIALSAIRYRQDIAVIWPQSAGVYSSLGLPVHASGIDFRQVDYKRESQDGQVVLAVSGQIVNTGKRELPVPQAVRVTLSDADHRELYHWTFKPDATLLKPGQAVPFTTRLSSPPPAARHLEVRFARDGK